MIMEKLHNERGIPEEQIISYHFDSMEHEDMTAKQIYAEFSIYLTERYVTFHIYTFSAKAVSDYLKAEHRTLDNETVNNYLEKLEKAYLLHRCSRYDLPMQWH